MIVNLAVEDNDIAPASGMHRLRSPFGQIDNGEAPMTERDARLVVHKDRAGVRAAMPQSQSHGINARA